jgi:hypothetical protein
VLNSEGPQFKEADGTSKQEYQTLTKNDLMRPESPDQEASPSPILMPAVQSTTTPEKWEIFAWAVRDAMSKTSGLVKIDCQYREKLQYEETLGYRKPEKYAKI